MYKYNAETKIYSSNRTFHEEGYVTLDKAREAEQEVRAVLEKVPKIREVKEIKLTPFNPKRFRLTKQALEKKVFSI